VPFDSVVVSSEKLKGADVTAAPALLPSTNSCTLDALLEAVARTLIVPDTLAAGAGEVTATVKGVF
jgi:hypothetical protein